MSDIGITLRGNHSGLSASLQKAGGDVKKFGEDATRSLRGVEDETRNLHKTLSALGGQMGTALTAAFAVNKVADFTHAIIDAQTNLDKLHNTLSFSLGAGQVTGQMDYLRKTTNALGLEFGSTAVMYAKFAAAARGTSMEGVNTQKVFESIGKASTVMGLSAADTQGVMLALTQILSKGTTQAEEIRGQLGERLPGAFAIAARAMGVTTQEFSKMLELGQVVSADFLPKFAAQMEKEVAGSFDKASHSMQASLNRMSNAWLEFKQTVASSGVASAIAAEVNGLTNYMALLTETMQQARANGAGAVGEISAAVGTMIARAPFDVLALGANTLNGALNMLSLGALKLNTNVDTLPGVFDTAAQRAAALDTNLLAAEKDLAQLRAKLDQTPDNIYLKSETHQAWLLVQELRAAKAAKDGLSGNTGPGNVSGIAAQYPTRSQSYAADAERVNKIRAGYEAVQQSLSGVSASYLKNLAALKAGFDEGMSTQEQYTKDVIALIDKETGFKKTAAQAQSAAAKAQEEVRKAAAKAQEDARKAAAKAEADWQNEVFKAAESESDAREKAIKTLKDQIDKETAHTAALGLSKEAIADLEVATLYETAAAKEQLATRADQIDWSGQMGDKYREEARLLRDLAAAKKAGGVRATELESEKEAKKYADDMLKEQKKAAEESGKYWEDALMRAFESGKGFFQSLWDTIKNTLKTQVLKVMVQGTMGTLGLGASGAAMAGGGGTDLLGLANIGSSLSNVYTGVSNLVSVGAQTFAGTMSVANALGTVAANATGTGISGLLATNGAYGTAAAGSAAGIGGSISAGLAAIPGWGWALMGAAAIAGILKGHGETRSGATYDTGADGLARYQQGPSGGEIAGTAARDLFNAAKTSIQDTLKLVGSSATITGYTAGLESSGKGKGFAFAGGYIDGKSFGDSDGREGHVSGQWAYQTMNPEQAMAAYVNELKKSTLEALQAATDIPALISNQLAGININALDQAGLDNLVNAIGGTVNAVNGFVQQINTGGIAELHDLGFAAAAGLIQFSGGLENLGTNLGTYYTNFYRAEEQRLQTIKNIGSATGGVLEPLLQSLTDGTKPAQELRDSFRALVESWGTAASLATEEGQKTYAALLGVSGAFAGLTPVLESVAAAVDTALEKMQADAASLAVELLAAQGDTAGAAAAQRALDTAGYSELALAQYDANTATRALIDSTTAAAQAAADIASERQGLQDQLDQLTMTSIELLEKQRNALDGSNRALFDQIQALTAAKAAAQAVASAAGAASDAQSAAVKKAQQVLDDTIKRQTASLNESVTAYQNAGDAMRKFRDDLSATMAGFIGPQMATTLAANQYGVNAAKAKLGDKDAMQAFSGLANDYLKASLASSSTAVDYQRVMATVLGDSNLSISTAERQIDIAEKQLAALEKLASGDVPKWYQYTASADFRATLNSIPNEAGTLNARQAYDNVQYAKQDSSYFAAGSAPNLPRYNQDGSSANNAAVVAELKALRAEMATANRVIALNTAKMARISTKWDDDGQPAVRTA